MYTRTVCGTVEMPALEANHPLPLLRTPQKPRPSADIFHHHLTPALQTTVAVSSPPRTGGAQLEQPVAEFDLFAAEMWREPDNSTRG